MMWEIGTVFATAFLVGLSGALMPGPLTTVALREALRRGFAAAPLAALGHSILEGVLVIALVFGLGQYLRLPSVTGAVALGGGFILVFMGLTMIQEVRKGQVTIETATVAAASETESRFSSGPAAPFLMGIAASISNPYWLLWWATIGAGYVAVSFRRGWPGAAAFFTGHITADFAWLMVIAGAILSGTRFMSNRVYRSIVAILGGFLLVLAAYFIYSGVSFLTQA